MKKLLSLLLTGALAAGVLTGCGGGLGSLAVNNGYQRGMTLILYVTVILLVILVQIIQSVGTRAANRLDHRITKTTPKSKKHTADKAGIS